MAEIEDVMDAQREAKRVVRRQSSEDVESVSVDSTDIKDMGEFSVFEVQGMIEYSSGLIGTDTKPFTLGLKTDGSVVSYKE